ncbi:MAG: hypothetical protein ACFCVA_18325 [Gammaproteobacteria bacterium]
MSRKILVALSLAALASAPAFALTFGEIDTDGDGVISAAEAEAAGINLSAADANQDGVIDAAEFEAAMGGPSE